MVIPWTVLWDGLKGVGQADEASGFIAETGAWLEQFMGAICTYDAARAGFHCKKSEVTLLYHSHDANQTLGMATGRHARAVYKVVFGFSKR